METILKQTALLLFHADNDNDSNCHAALQGQDQHQDDGLDEQFFAVGKEQGETQEYHELLSECADLWSSPRYKLVKTAMEKQLAEGIMEILREQEVKEGER
ncbi:ARM repeat-containing protein [Apiospora arundinis]